MNEVGDVLKAKCKRRARFPVQFHFAFEVASRVGCGLCVASQHDWLLSRPHSAL